MVGTLGPPDGHDDRPAVLIGHEGPGLDGFQKGRAKQLAVLGYVAFALDYHGDGEPIEDRQAMMDRLDELSADSVRQIPRVLKVVSPSPTLSPSPALALIAICPTASRNSIASLR